MRSECGKGHIMKTNADPSWPAKREVNFVFIPLRIRHDQGRTGIPILILCRDIKKNGAQSIPLRRLVDPKVSTTIPNEADRNLLSEIAINSDLYRYSSTDCSKFLLNPNNYDHFLPLLCATRRCFVEPVESRFHVYTIENTPTLEIDDGPPWSLTVPREIQGIYSMAKANIIRNSESIQVEEIQAIYPGDESNPGVLIHKGLVSRYLFQPTLYSWIESFLRRKRIELIDSPLITHPIGALRPIE